MSQKNELLSKLLDQRQHLDKVSLLREFVHNLEYSVGKFKTNTTRSDLYQALAYTVRDVLVDRYNETQERYASEKAKRLYYLSMEFLLGRLLTGNLINLGIDEDSDDAMRDIGHTLEEISEYEPDAGLGNGGLGRLAACFLDSLTSLCLPATGSGIRYEYGIFHQNLVNGEQREAPDAWLSRGNPWELMRSDILFPVNFYGYTEDSTLSDGKKIVRWYPGETVMAMAYDILIPGYQTNTVNNLRLWSARASSDFNFDYFNHGDYIRAVEDKVRSESISKVLYPNENVEQGRELRLKQEYFFVTATLQDALKSFLKIETDFHKLPDLVIFHMNDTHPAIAVAELMRLLIDTYDLSWEDAWAITPKCLAYTNHTVMPEALERWDLSMFTRLLPRHTEIIFRINYEFLEFLKKKKIPAEVIRNVSIIEEGDSKKVRMANLAIVGSCAVNGVAALHTELLKTELFRDFYQIFPERFHNKTNGITHRRWIVASNPSLSALITKKIGSDWIRNPDKLKELEPFSGDEEFQNDWYDIKLENKRQLAKVIQFSTGIIVNPESLFDVQIKRMHEYKRQLLNVLRLILDYQRIKEHPNLDYTPRTVIFGGKAAPGYYRAKLIIRLIHCIAKFVNEDPAVNEKLKIIFLPNYNVSLAEKIFPASDLSEQISTAGTEASGTGNMKFMLNGALTVGTLDGANIEILAEAGEENIYIFGRTVEEIRKLSRSGYNPVEIYESSRDIQSVLNSLKWNYFNPTEPGLFQEIFHSLTYGGDPYFHLADFASYIDIQKRISRDFSDQVNWKKKSILNTARSGKFTTDRTIAEYAGEIWDLKPVS